jgi:uncharacterized protein
VSGLELLLLLGAGLCGGLAGSITGLASLFSYPALLAVGLGPIAANVTNTVALLGVSAGAGLGSQPELKGQAGRVRELAAAAVLGGGTGAGLLLLTPSDTFERIAPWLIGAASLTILLRPRVREPGERERERDGAGPVLVGGVFLIGIYGGYFGAAAGVMLLALLLVLSDEPLARSNALKNVVLGMANLVAAVGFSLLGPVHWGAVVPLALGLFSGGRLGPIVVRHSNPVALRTVIGIVGVALAIKLGIDAY